MNLCRICQGPLDEPDFVSTPPAITSISTLLDVSTQVFVCTQCAHAQTPNLEDIQVYYDTEYRISLQTDGHDQVYALDGDEVTFRTQHQADLMLETDFPRGARVLDYGAAKASTLKRVFESRPDIEPFVFDVSSDYRSFWQGWIPDANQAEYLIPDGWSRKFDLVSAHFVLEHVAEPVAVLLELAEMLGPNGKLFFTVPDPAGNSGDLLVVDHLNHFSEVSLATALHLAGMRISAISQNAFRGAHVVVAELGEPSSAKPNADDTVESMRSHLRQWQRGIHMLESVDRRIGDRQVGIYGAGFYGSLIASRLGQVPKCFLDSNPHLQGSIHMNVPVLAPADCPQDLDLLLVGLNPVHAATIVPSDASWLPSNCEVVYFPD